MEKCLARLNHQQQLLVHRRLCYSIYINAMQTLEEQVLKMMDEDNEKAIKALKDKMLEVNIIDGDVEY